MNRLAFERADNVSRTLRYSLSTLGILLTPFIILVVSNVNAGRKLRSVVPVQAQDDVGESRYLLTINLYNQLIMTPAERSLELSYALAMAKQVTSLYQGHADYLPRTGVLVGFEHSDDHDRSFQVMCAAFVLVHLLD